MHSDLKAAYDSALRLALGCNLGFQDLVWQLDS